MAFIPVPNVVEVQTIYELDSQIVENTSYYLHGAGVPTLADVQDLVADVSALVQTNLIPLLSNVIHLVRLVGTLLETVDALSYILAVTPPVAGTLADFPLPSNVSYAIQFKTNNRGRSFRGRNYVPCLGTSQAADNTVTNTARSALTLAYQAIGAAGGTDWEQVVVSRYHNKAPRTVGIATPITAYTTADNIVDSMRRRLPGRGR